MGNLSENRGWQRALLNMLLFLLHESQITEGSSKYAKCSAPHLLVYLLLHNSLPVQDNVSEKFF